MLILHDLICKAFHDFGRLLSFGHCVGCKILCSYNSFPLYTQAPLIVQREIGEGDWRRRHDAEVSRKSLAEVRFRQLMSN